MVKCAKNLTFSLLTSTSPQFPGSVPSSSKFTSTLPRSNAHTQPYCDTQINQFGATHKEFESPHASFRYSVKAICVLVFSSYLVSLPWLSTVRALAAAGKNTTHYGVSFTPIPSFPVSPSLSAHPSLREPGPPPAIPKGSCTQVPISQIENTPRLTLPGCFPARLPGETRG